MIQWKLGAIIVDHFLYSGWSKPSHYSTQIIATKQPSHPKWWCREGTPSNCREHSGLGIIARWWFETCFMCTSTWGHAPIWLIIFNGVETTNKIVWKFAHNIWVITQSKAIVETWDQDYRLWFREFRLSPLSVEVAIVYPQYLPGLILASSKTAESLNSPLTQPTLPTPQTPKHRTTSSDGRPAGLGRFGGDRSDAFDAKVPCPRIIPNSSARVGVGMNGGVEQPFLLLGGRISKLRSYTFVCSNCVLFNGF